MAGQDNFYLKVRWDPDRDKFHRFADEEWKAASPGLWRKSGRPSLENQVLEAISNLFLSDHPSHMSNAERIRRIKDWFRARGAPVPAKRTIVKYLRKYEIVSCPLAKRIERPTGPQKVSGDHQNNGVNGDHLLVR